jgi:hypothetical protein
LVAEFGLLKCGSCFGFLDKVSSAEKHSEMKSRVARFFLVHDTKTGKKSTKLAQNVPNGRKTTQMFVKYSKRP